jgi:hypothetical protein
LGDSVAKEDLEEMVAKEDLGDSVAKEDLEETEAMDILRVESRLLCTHTYLFAMCSHKIVVKQHQNHRMSHTMYI